MSRHVVAATSEIKPGERKLVTIKGREIGVFNVDGAFFALANRCPHAGGPMRPWQSGPPSCGQRLASAKNLPPTLNTPISRPATVTSLHPPGGTSPARATT